MNNNNTIPTPREFLNSVLGHSDLYVDQNDNPIIEIKVHGGGQTYYPLTSPELGSQLRLAYQNIYQGDLPEDTFINKVITALHDEVFRQNQLSQTKGIQSKHRVYESVEPGTRDTRIFWNTNPSSNEAIEITKDGWKANVTPDNVSFMKGKGTTNIQTPDQLTLDQAIKHLPKYWNHFLVPEEMRLSMFAQLITAFFTREDQPIGVHWSIGSGGVGKSPTVLRMRDLIDPTKTGVTPVPTDDQGLITLLASQYSVVLDDANRKTLDFKKQSKLKTYQTASGGVQSMRALYSNNVNITVETKGMLNITTNEPALLIEDSTVRRAIVYGYPESRSDVGIQGVQDYGAAFERDLNLLRGVLLTLTVEVLNHLPYLKGDKNIHSLTRYSTVVQALEIILKGHLSPVMRQSVLKQIELENLSEHDLLLNDLQTILDDHAGKFDDKSQVLVNQLKYLTGECSDEERFKRENASDYPKISRKLLERLRSDEDIEALRLKGIKLKIYTKYKQEWVAMEYLAMTDAA